MNMECLLKTCAGLIGVTMMQCVVTAGLEAVKLLIVNQYTSAVFTTGNTYV